MKTYNQFKESLTKELGTNPKAIIASSAVVATGTSLAILNASTLTTVAITKTSAATAVMTTVKASLFAKRVALTCGIIVTEEDRR